MKHTFMKSCVAALAIAALVWLVGCDNNLTYQGGGGTGGGSVEIQIGTSEARTLHPDLVFTKYVLSFTGPGSETHEPVALTGGNASAIIALVPGAWTIDAVAYTGTGTAEKETAQGSVVVTVLETDSVQAHITLGPIPGTETGTFSYAINLPVDTSTATLSLTDAATNIAVPGSPIDLTGVGGSSGMLDLAPGSYLMQIRLTKAGGETTGLAEALHIYAGLTTSVSGGNYDFNAIPLSGLAAYLASLSANTAETPHTVALAASVTINTTDTSASGVWTTINSTVETAGKYVILDLSACTATGNMIGDDWTPTNNHFNIIQGNQYIKGVTLPSTLIRIGQSAFRECSGITSVTIPDSVTSIGDYAFFYCSGITSVTIPDGVTSIGDAAFYRCSGITSVTIPDSVTSIGQEAFYGCSGLTAFTVAENNTAYSAQDGILYNKAKTTIISVPPTKSGALTLPNTLTSIGQSAFSYCRGLTSVTIPDSVISIGDYTFLSCSGLTSVTIPDGVTSIGDHTFAYCSGITSVTIPDGVTSIGDAAFYRCSGITSVTIPDSVTSIGDGAFGSCIWLTAFTVVESNTAYSAQDGILYDKAKTTLVSVPGAKSGALTLPNTLTIIGDYAFSGCSGLTSVTIPGSVTIIGNQAFYGCSGLTSVTIPGSVTIIGNQAFFYCSGLTSIIFGMGSNITTAWSNYSFPDNNVYGYGYSGDSLWAVYTSGNKAGMYTRSGNTWTQQ